jgi:MFS family permease
MARDKVFSRDLLFYRFCAYGFLKNLRFFEPFMVLFFREMGFSFLQIGTLFGIREAATWLLELPTGFVADAFGRRASMVASMLAYLSSFMVFHLFPVFWVYALAMILFGAGEAFRTGTHKAIILEHLRIKGIADIRVDYYGATRGASQLGSAVNALLAAALVFTTGSYRFIFLAAMAPYIVNLVNLATYPKSLDGHLEGEHHRVRIRETFRHFRMSLTRGPAVRGVLNSAVYDGFFRASKEYLQPILKTLAVSLPVFAALSGDRRTAIAVGVVYFFIYLGTSWASHNAGRFSRSVRSQAFAVNLTFAAGGCTLALAGLFAWISLPVLSVLFFLLFFGLQNLRRPMLVAWVSEKISHRAMASGLSAESQAKSLVAAAVAPLLGLLADKVGVGMALVITALVMTGLLPLLRLRREQVSSPPVS